MRLFFRRNGLSIVLLLMFLVFIVGQGVAGLRNTNEERLQHGRPALSFAAYVGSSEFLEAVFENWESEFFQMGLFVLLTAILFQKGSAESNALPEERAREKSQAARIRGWGRTLYEHSLSLALLTLFLVSFAGHAIAGCRAYNGELQEHGGNKVSVLQYLGTSRFWFESLQNWQSEFLSIAAIVLLSIFLREKGSSQSKEVEAPNAQTGIQGRFVE